MMTPTCHLSYSDAVAHLCKHLHDKGEFGSFSLAYMGAEGVATYYHNTEVEEAVQATTAYRADPGLECIELVSCALGGEADGGGIVVYGHVTDKEYTERLYFVVYP